MGITRGLAIEIGFNNSFSNWADDFIFSLR